MGYPMQAVLAASAHEAIPHYNIQIELLRIKLYAMLHG
jgi:hypothetical protein